MKNNALNLETVEDIERNKVFATAFYPFVIFRAINERIRQFLPEMIEIEKNDELFDELN